MKLKKSVAPIAANVLEIKVEETEFLFLINYHT